MSWVLIFLGAGAGGLMRAGLQRWVQEPNHVPWMTLGINVAGSFLIGICAANLPPDAQQWRTVLMAGFLGGFTTFSAFSLDVVQLSGRTAPMMPLLYGAGSVFLSIGACWIGQALRFGSMKAN